MSIGTVTDLASGTTPTATITGTTANPILNFGLTRGATGNTGATPNITIGTTTTIAYNDATLSSVVLDATSTTLNPKFNFSIKQGPQGPQGATGATGATGGKGDKGDKGDTGATGDTSGASAAAASAAASAAVAATAAATASTAATAAAVSAAAADASAAANTTAITGLTGRVTTLETTTTALQTQTDANGANITTLQNKTINQTAIAGSTTFNGNMNIGTPSVSAVVINGSTIDINALLINLNGIVSMPSSFNGFFNQGF